MKWYSTLNEKQSVSLKEAVLKGIADDGGLFMPSKIPAVDEVFLSNIGCLSLQEISFHIARKFLGEDIPDVPLKDMIDKALNFPIPLRRLDDELYILELFHGPTLAFKDVGARVMAELLSYLVRDSQTTLTILVATSGDTGSAVANAFFQTPGIRVIILYPGGKVSEIQEKQFTTLGGNIHAVEIKGSFDDCQALAKRAFSDADLKERLRLTSANSINIARLIPQSFYYFHAYARLADKGRPVVFSVPSGNFGNLMAGIIARKMGLPVSKFIASTNINDAVPRYLRTGVYVPRKMKKTISNAMDVGNPSNFLRMTALYQKQLSAMREDIVGARFTDDQTRKAIRDVFMQYGYIMDPHSAVAYLGLKQFRSAQRARFSGILLATAHPAKFVDIVGKAIGSKIDLPQILQTCLKRPKKSQVCSNRFKDLKELLLDFS